MNYSARKLVLACLTSLCSIAFSADCSAGEPRVEDLDKTLPQTASFLNEHKTFGDLIERLRDDGLITKLELSMLRNELASLKIREDSRLPRFHVKKNFLYAGQIGWKFQKNNKYVSSNNVVIDFGRSLSFLHMFKTARKAFEKHHDRAALVELLLPNAEASETKGGIADSVANALALAGQHTLKLIYGDVFFPLTNGVLGYGVGGVVTFVMDGVRSFFLKGKVTCDDGRYMATEITPNKEYLGVLDEISKKEDVCTQNMNSTDWLDSTMVGHFQSLCQFSLKGSAFAATSFGDQENCPNPICFNSRTKAVRVSPGKLKTIFKNQNPPSCTYETALQVEKFLKDEVRDIIPDKDQTNQPNPAGPAEAAH